MKSDERKQKNITPPGIPLPQVEGKKPEEKFSKAIEDIEQIISEQQSAVGSQQNHKERLKAKKAELENHDIEIKKQFKDTEDKIKDLPEEIKRRHRDFVKHYDDNLRELKTNIDDIDKAKDKSDIDTKVKRAKAHLEKVKPPKKHQALDPNKLPHRTPEVREFKAVDKQSITNEEQKLPSQLIQVATSGSLSGLLSQILPIAITSKSAPTEADLSETIEVQLTPEIRAKALELQNSPVKIYEFVKNSIDFEPYYGSLKGAQQTLVELAGNDIDQSSLLIALLRAANIPARYVSGPIELPIERLMNWIGSIKDPMTAAKILATNGVPGTLLTEGGQVKFAQFEHTWVEAYVDMFPSMGAIQRQASYWTPLDPSLKETESSDSINISKTVPFDEATYLSGGDDMPPVLSYIYKLKDFYNTNYDYNFMKIFHVSVKKRQEFGILMGTLPYKVVSEQRYAEVPDAKRHKISLNLFSDGIYNTGETFSVTKLLPEIAGKKVTISNVPATAFDQSVINQYGGLLKTPAYLVSVRPEVKLDAAVILTGPVMGLGASLLATTTLTSPNMNTEIKTTDLSHGISYAVGIPALTYPGTQLVGQIDRLRVLEGTLHDSINAMDARAGELLHNIAIEYFGQLNNTSRSIEGIMHVQNTKMPSIAFVSADAIYTEVFGIPISPPIMRGFGIDAMVASSPMPIDGDLEQRKEFNKQWGLNSSYLEHKILENLLGIESISAVKALQIAAKNGIPLYAINKTNIDSILPTLTISARDKSDIQNAVNAGKEVTVSRDNITLGDWTGVGYIARDPGTGSGAYMISNELGGGGTAVRDILNFIKEFSRFLLHQKNAVFLAGDDPMNTIASDFEIDTFITCARMVPILIGFNYSPICIGKVSKDEFVRRVKHKYTWLVYYAGHAGVTESGNTFLALAGPFRSVHDVFASDVSGADAKIVFLNGCHTGENNSFQSSFGINGWWEDGSVSRREVLLGWSGSCGIKSSGEFAYEFWLQLGKGKTVSEASSAVGKIGTTFDPKMEFYGDESTKLVPLP